MRASYTAKELISLELSGLPGSERGLQLKAGREQWPFSWGNGQGGPYKKYLSQLLPKSVRQAILKKEDIDSLVPVNHHEQTASSVMPEQEPKAMAKADLLRLYLQAKAAAPWGKKNQARDSFMLAYNSGIAYPKLFDLLAKQSHKTLDGWERKVKKAGGNTAVLADNRGYHKRGKSSIDSLHTDIFLHCVLHPNQPKVAEAYRITKAIMNARKIDNPHSEATYRRWLKKWIETNHHIWVFNREGATAWNDKCAYYIERDYNLINVGDILVADGHVLNFEVLDPWTGKPKRMTLILFYDMKSNMPLGWEIMPTEDTRAISAALYRAILMLGKIPKVVYLDNGKAFRSKYFRGSDNLEEEGLAGVYERLGIKTIFAWPYHGQSKTVERFFGTMAELERALMPTYSGTSIATKPARMNRGEKLHREVYERLTGGKVLTMEQAHIACALWFDDYAKRPQRGHLNGTAPRELFRDQRGPGIDRAELTFLMMTRTIKHVHRNGISWAGKGNYYHPALYGRRHAVQVRYDLQDDSSLYIFDLAGEFICAATPVDKVHPAAAQLGGDEHKVQLVEHIELKQSQKKEAAMTTREMLEVEILPQHRRRLEEVGLMPAGVVGEIGQPGGGRKQVAQITSIDQKQLEAELAELEQANLAQLPAPDDSSEAASYEPEVINEDEICLDGLSGADLHEQLIRLEVRGLLTTAQATTMKFYENSPEYEPNGEYFEELRMKEMLMLQGRPEALEA